jgi:hypothetical protein
MKKTFDLLVKATEDNKMTLEELRKSFTLREFILLVFEVSKKIAHSCMNAILK